MVDPFAPKAGATLTPQHLGASGDLRRAFFSNRLSFLLANCVRDRPPAPDRWSVPLRCVCRTGPGWRHPSRHPASALAATPARYAAYGRSSRCCDYRRYGAGAATVPAAYPPTPASPCPAGLAARCGGSSYTRPRRCPVALIAGWCGEGQAIENIMGTMNGQAIRLSERCCCSCAYILRITGNPHRRPYRGAAHAVVFSRRHGSPLCCGRHAHRSGVETHELSSSLALPT
jgi:hypothetical protein